MCGFLWDKYLPDQIQQGRFFEPNQAAAAVDTAVTWHFTTVFLATVYGPTCGSMWIVPMTTPFFAILGYFLRGLTPATALRSLIVEAFDFRCKHVGESSLHSDVNIVGKWSNSISIQHRAEGLTVCHDFQYGILHADGSWMVADMTYADQVDIGTGAWVAEHQTGVEGKVVKHWPADSASDSNASRIGSCHVKHDNGKESWLFSDELAVVAAGQSAGMIRLRLSEGKLEYSRKRPQSNEWTSPEIIEKSSRSDKAAT